MLLELFIRENICETMDTHTEIGMKEDATGNTDWFFNPNNEKNWNEAVMDLLTEWRPSSPLQNRIPFQERRWTFIRNYAQFLRDCQTLYKEASERFAMNPPDDAVWQEFSDVLDNMERVANEYLNEVQCLSRRAQSLVDLVGYLPLHSCFPSRDLTEANSSPYPSRGRKAINQTQHPQN